MPITNGQFHILPVLPVQANRGVGADTDVHGGPIGSGKPVVLNGDNQIWKLEHKEGDVYNLTLKESFHTLVVGNDVFVNGTIPSGSLWRIVQLTNKKDEYVILRIDEESGGPARAWTLPELESLSKVPVVLEPLPTGEPRPGQLWFFKRVLL